ncbi:MAG: hypothetical protein FD181_2493 [Prolixibacteraceae bacterium]|nr:MAG: hypothetical protein FD181_2493 [Prolixibacteraceae bacterium]
MKKLVAVLFTLVIVLVLNAQNIKMSLKNTVVETFDYQEVRLNVSSLSKSVNPFSDVTLKAVFTPENGQPVEVEGFCDEPSGKIYKIRFMPRQAGKYSFKADFTVKGRQSKTYNGSFTATASKRNGPIRVDKENPTHFVYENSGKHYFWNSTTCYWLMGWTDEQVSLQAIDRLASLGINRIRVAIAGRSHGGERWNEKYVKECAQFSFMLNPWVAKNPQSLDEPQFDVTRFNLEYWQRFDRMLSRAREKGIVVSVIFYVDGLDHATDPFKKANMGNEFEQMYYRYAVARFSGFENIMWDIANEYHLFRSPEWAEKMGTLLKNSDHANHLISVHGSSDFPFRKSPWVDVVMYQSWDECGGYSFMLDCFRQQAATGRILPQINEEYGYEGHYSIWGCGPTATKEPNARSGYNRSQLAWEICMAGGYQTTGETAEFGTGAGEDTGGGWINGRGNDKMTMLNYYRIMKNCFEQTEYWKLKPASQLVNYGNLCLANPGKEYLIYSRVQHCRLSLPGEGKYTVTMINPRTGEQTQLPLCTAADNFSWHYPKEMNEDWVFILKRVE